MALLKSYGCGSGSARPPATAAPCHPGPAALSPMAKPIWAKARQGEKAKWEGLPLLARLSCEAGRLAGEAHQLRGPQLQAARAPSNAAQARAGSKAASSKLKQEVLAHAGACFATPGLLAALGRGAMANVPKKLGTNAASSAEAEAVPAGERLPKRAWLRHFRAEQGGSGKEDVLLQGSKSAIILQSRYPCSTGKGSQRIHARHYFAAGKLKSKELKIAHCPAGGLVAGYSSKPLQGSLLAKHRSAALGAKQEDFGLHKEMYAAALKQYDLYANEDGLFGL